MIPANLSFVDVALSLPLETLETLLKNDSSLVNCTGYGGQTALHKSAYVGNYNVTLLLLKHGADPNFQNDIGETSLHIACSKGSLKLLATLLNYKGNPNIPSKSGSLPLHYAAQNGSIVVIQFLSEVYNFNLEIPDGNGVTILHLACAGGHLDLVRFLLEVKQIFCLSIDAEGNSVLHSAALGGLSGVCWRVVSHGGESLLTNKNKYGQTPLQIAKSSLTVSQDCLKWLERWTREYEAKKKISSPRLQMILLNIIPLFIFYLGIYLSIEFRNESQYQIGVPAFVLLIIVIQRQQHRINHPSRWANPIYLGCYTTGLLSSIACFTFAFAISHPIYFYYFIIVLYVIQLYFLFYLINKDPGYVPKNTYVRDTLIKLSEDRLQEEERYCPQCFVAAPRSSHHCRLCERCVLHLDHHCLFLNTCVGANNHWHFVMFLVLNVGTLASFLYSGVLYGLEKVFSASDSLVMDVVSKWMHQEVWILLLMLCNAGSLLWAIRLLKYQYNVIGTQQTTLNRIKCGVPQTKYSIMDKIKNFLLFLFNKKVTLKMASHYFEA